MPYTTIEKINSNPELAPIDDKENFIKRINANKCASMMIDFIYNPYLLTHKEENYITYWSGENRIHIDEETYENLLPAIKVFEGTRDTPILPEEYLDLINNKKDVEKYENKVEESGSYYKIKYVYGLDKDKWYKPERVDYILSIGIRIIRHYPKYTRLNLIKNSQLSIKSWSCIGEEKFLPKVVDCFKVIEKEFKLIQEEKRGYYKRYFTTKPFEAFEECGIEVLYAKKGYAIDGKRLPNFNRGSVWGLKHSLKQNNIKLKDVGTKKDDLIKYLMKL